MAGGRGERFWPKSRLSRPKHLLSIVGEQSMLAQTVQRLQGLVPQENIFIITNKEQQVAVQETCPDLSKDQIIAEPIGRDTASAVGLAKSIVKQKDPQGVFAILPADHVVHDVENFKKCLNSTFDIASETASLVTLGIQPTGPSTAYGYIKKGDQVDTYYKVDQFVEKPNLETAQSYVDSGNYFWNAGMFTWTVPALEKALNTHCPELAEGLTQLEKRLEAGETLEAVLAELYATLPKISVDYALMEKADNVVTVPSTFDWDDVGEWPAIARHHESDENGNVTRGEGLIEDGSGNIVISEDGHLTALIGVNDLIVVQAEGATLVCHKDRAQDIKKLVKQVSENPEYKHLV